MAVSEHSPSPIDVRDQSTVERGGEDAGHLGPVVTAPAWLTLRTLGRVAVAAPIGLVLVLGYTHRWTYDDGFAYFRVIDQLFEGNGPVFNAGERVESFISPLWVAALALGELVSPFRLEYTASALSLAFTVIGIVLATSASARLMVDRRQSHPVLLPLGLAVFAVLWPVWVWATGGTEVGLTLGWLGLCSWMLASWATTPAGSGLPVPTLVVIGAGWLVRPELAVSSAIFVATVVIVTLRTTRARVAATLIAVALPLAYQLFRMGYYGLVTSSASVAREDTTPRPGFGWDYFVDFVSPYLLLVPIVAIALGAYVPFFARSIGAGDVRRAACVAAIGGSGLAHAAVLIVFVGGDGPHARVLLPALFATLAPVFVIPATRAHLAALVVAGGWAVCCGALLRPPNDGGSRVFTNAYPGNGLTSDDAGFAARGAQPWMDGPGFYLADSFEPTGGLVELELADPDMTVVATHSGTVAYALGPDIHVVDLYGAGDPLIAHQRLDLRLVPGHEKSAYGPWLIARFAASPSAVPPGAITLVPPFTPPVPALEYLEDVQWARSALRCDSIDRLVDAHDDSLTPGRFIGNVWNAMSNTSLRYDTFPRDVHRFDRCTDDTPADVVLFWEGVSTGSTLDRAPSPGDVAMAGRCDAVFVGTDSRQDPWQPVDGRTFRATIQLDPDKTDRGFAAVFVIGPDGDDASVVWIETDGEGNFRVLQDVKWYPQIQQAWTPINPDAPVEVSIAPALANARWQTFVNGVHLVDVPMLGSAEEGGPVTVASYPRLAPAGTDYPTIEHVPPDISRICQSIIAHHPTPSRAGHAFTQFEPIPG